MVTMTKKSSSSRPSHILKEKKKPTEITKRVLVVSEGTVTEPAYFKLLRREIEPLLGLTIKVQPKENTNAKRNTDPVSIVKECARFKNDDLERSRSSKGDVHPYEACFAIVDVDDYDQGNPPPLTQAAQLAIANDIYLLITNKKFESWLIWHSVKDVTPKRESKEISKQCESLNLISGKRLAPHFPVANYPQAIERAKRIRSVAAGQIGPNPSSAMPLFFEILKKL